LRKSFIYIALALAATLFAACAAEDRYASVRIDEVMASNGSTLVLDDGSCPDWFELYNPTDRDISLAGCGVMRAGDPLTITMLPNVDVPARGYLVVCCDGLFGLRDGMAHVDLKLKRAGDSIVLMGPTGAQIDFVSFPALATDSVYCLDDAGTWSVSPQATPGYANGAAGLRGATGDLAGLIAITEVMAKNASWRTDAAGNAYDYVEITNGSPTAVDLAGWFLSDNAEKPRRWTFPEVTVPAGGCLLVWCSGSGTVDGEGRIHAGFRLSKRGEELILTRPDGTTVSRVSVPALEADQVYSLVQGAWRTDAVPSPGYVNGWQGEAAALDDYAASDAAVRINEVCASSSENVAGDWIELYNAGGEAVDLSGWGLSDNSAKPRKWQFPAGTVIPAGGYAGVLCDGSGEVKSNGTLATNFRLSLEGGYAVSLSRPDGGTEDRVYVGPQRKGLSLGRVEGSAGFWYLEQPTPGAANPAIGWKGIAPAPEIDARGGLYDAGEQVRVTMTAPEGAFIYYTLDGSAPDRDAPLYTGPFTIASTTVLRAMTYMDGCLQSDIRTESYLFDAQDRDVRVVSLVADPDDMFGSQGVYSDYMNEHECAANIEVFETDGTRMLDQGCGAGLHGADSRKQEQKGFNIIARSIYGGNRFRAPLISANPYTEYQSVILHASGEDALKSHMCDAVLTSLAEGTSVMYQRFEPCILYINGEYWGMYYIRDRMNEYGVCQFAGWEGQEDDIDLVAGNTNVHQGSDSTFQALLEYVKSTDPSDPSFYDEVGKVIDIRNYMEYIGLEMFVGNGDTLNVKRYRNKNADGLWRWCLYDLDWGFSVDTNSINRWLTPGGMGSRKATDNTLFIQLMKNDRFRDEFLTWFGEQLAGPFSTERVLEKIDACAAMLDPLMDRQLARWGQTRAKWEREVQVLRDYAIERPRKLMGYFQGKGTGEVYFALSDAEMEHYFSAARDVALAYGG